jgi:MFS family permease
MFFIAKERHSMSTPLKHPLWRFARSLWKTGNMLPKHPVVKRNVVTMFLWWRYLRAVFHRGYVLASSLYFVVIAHLSASQIVLLGAVMAVTLLLSDIPTGVWSDALGRKRFLVIGQVLLAVGMVLTGVVTAFPLMVVTQVFWGLGWAFLGGADVAWITDELNQSQEIARVLTTSARWDLAGGATGMVVFGVLSWATSLGAALVVSGIGMALLALGVAVWFVERNFMPTRENRWNTSLTLFRLGAHLSLQDREIVLVFVATLLVNSAGLVEWLFPKQLVNLGFPSDPILWYTALGILSSALGFLVLRIVQVHIDGVGVARRTYALACLLGMLGLIVLAKAPTALLGSLGILLISGIAFNVTRTVSVIWVNRRTTSDVRATVHSFLSQAESFGEIFGGFALAALVQALGISLVLIASGVVMALTGGMVAWLSTDRVRVDE